MSRHLFTIPNLSATTVSSSQPWVDDPKLPDGITKEEFYDWCKAPSTRHCFVSGFEGLTPCNRINEQANPPWLHHALIADFDAKHTMAQVRGFIDERCNEGLKPAMAQITLSGNVRLIWWLEEPLVLPKNLVAPYLKLLSKTLELPKLLAGLDDNISKATQYFCWCGPTEIISTDAISKQVIQSCLIQAIRNNKQYKGEGDIIVPFDKVKAEVDKRFPGRWDGEFADKARGVCFWDATAVNTTAAVVTPTGMLAFSQDKPFYSWADIFGSQFVKAFEQERIAEPILNYFYDGQRYWTKNNMGEWIHKHKEDARMSLVIHYGLRRKPPAEDKASEVDVALDTIQNNCRVDGVIPALYRSEDVINHSGNRYLNISKVKVTEPADGVFEWGEKGEFPWLSKFYDSLFLDTTALPYLLAWIKRFYESARAGSLNQGQAIFMAGPPRKGKTVWGNVILGALMGGSADASLFLTDKTQFNGTEMKSPIWNVDDEASNTSWERKTRWTAMIKKSVANTQHSFQEKYMNAVMVSWSGRVVVTLNDDPVSMEQIPELGASILDKLMLFHANGPQVVFPPNDELHAIVRKETPFFAKWLVDWRMPDELLGDNRFGIKCYHGEEIVKHAMTSAPSSAFAELIDTFADLERAHDSTLTHWEGNATALIMRMLIHESLSPLINEYRQNTRKLGHALRQLSTKMPSRVSIGKKYETSKASIQWVIDLREEGQFESQN